MKTLGQLVFLGAVVVQAILGQDLDQASDARYLLDLYLDPPVTFNASFYMFNLTNPQGYVAGEKPIFQELGPYIYRVRYHKDNLKRLGDDAVEFDDIKTYHFCAECSGDHKESDTITTINFNLVAALHTSPKHKGAINSFEQLSGGGPLITKTVEELLWGFSSPLVQLGIDNTPAGEPKRPSNIVGVFGAETNGTKVATLTIATGLGQNGFRGKILKWNGKPELEWWSKGSRCNQLMGSEGFSYQYKIKDSDRLYFTRSETCRAIPLIYESDVMTSSGISAKRFSPPPNAFRKDNPENSCYCPPQGCPPNGVQDVSTCNYGAPIMLSWPHFLYGDEKLQTDVVGLRADPSIHETFFDLEPNTGLAVRARVAMQTNIKVSPDQGIAQVYKDMVFPFLWFSISSEAHLSEDVQARLKEIFGRIPE